LVLKSFCVVISLLHCTLEGQGKMALWIVFEPK